MTTNAELASRLEELFGASRAAYAAYAEGHLDGPAADESWTTLTRELVRNITAILAALRASRPEPEPVADAVEAAARAIAGSRHTALDLDDLIDGRPLWRFYEGDAKSALSALPRPEADEGAVRKADEIFDDITRGGPTVDAVMREDWATVAEWMRQRAEDGLAVTRAAIAAAQEGQQ